ncbi:hypothetical protein F52700_6850 [Fusarium sp. NRRL 52700]|nr:hypothetical protein F52700_6850 [Fusarium sp. NRRL 52700]
MESPGPAKQRFKAEISIERKAIFEIIDVPKIWLRNANDLSITDTTAKVVRHKFYRFGKTWTELKFLKVIYGSDRVLGGSAALKFQKPSPDSDVTAWGLQSEWASKSSTTQPRQEEAEQYHRERNRAWSEFAQLQQKYFPPPGDESALAGHRTSVEEKTMEDLQHTSWDLRALLASEREKNEALEAQVERSVKHVAELKATAYANEMADYDLGAAKRVLGRVETEIEDAAVRLEEFNPTSLHKSTEWIRKRHSIKSRMRISSPSEHSSRVLVTKKMR